MARVDSIVALVPETLGITLEEALAASEDLRQPMTTMARCASCSTWP